jgi:hypothetical protein
MKATIEVFDTVIIVSIFIPANSGTSQDRKAGDADEG